jgi:hypothetical protein
MMLVAGLLLALLPVPAAAQSAGDDDYTRYELLAPESASFRIVYDVTAITAGARFYFNPIRQGSEASDESVIDLATGQPLRFEVVGGRQAQADGMTRADPQSDYIKVHLARPVPEGGEQRLRIIKTYKDPKSYYREGDLIVFDRSLGIKRNAVVLPAGFEVVSCNVPSQVMPEDDGRIKVSFWNTHPGAAPLVVRARQLPPRTATANPSRPSSTPGPRSAASAPASAERPVAAAPALRDIQVSERAVQDREIVYFLQQPGTHAFSLYHDYTESREGVDKYINIVRAGSTVSEPRARNLDTGEALKTEILKGEAITKAGIKIDEPVDVDTEIVVIWFPAVKKGQTTRLRIEETYTDAGRYGLLGEELVWNRSFGRPSNDMVLPEGWYLTTSSLPVVISQEADGRIRLRYVNPRPDSLEVFVKARRRGTP